MLSHVKGKISVMVSNAAKRGNPLAKQLVTRETKRFAESLPQQPSIVSGEFMIPDLERPLPEDMQGGMLGDYEMVPLTPEPVDPERLCGRKVATAVTGLGTYGMGGYGFFGLLFEDEHWLIIPILEAPSWIFLDGRVLQDEDDPALGWIVAGDDTQMSERLTGAQITSAQLSRFAMRLEFDNGAVLAIDGTPLERPGAKETQFKRFLDTDDLAAALFLSPSGEIYV